MTNTNTLPTNVIDKDHKLEDAQARSTEGLAKLRWHWTLDEDNPDRVSMRQYARDVGRSETAIRNMANGYAEWVRTAVRTGVQTRPLADSIALTRVTSEKAEVAEILADVRGVSPRTVIDDRVDLARVTARAQELAEQRGTDVAHEARGIAERAKTTARQAKERREADQKNHPFAYVEVSGSLAKARDAVTKALTESEGVEFDDDYCELLRTKVAKVRAVLDLLDLRLDGTPDIDWDAELASLNTGE